MRPIEPQGSTLYALAEAMTMPFQRPIRAGRHLGPSTLRLAGVMTGGLMCAAFARTDALAAPLLFDLDAFSSGVASAVDITRFNQGNNLSPGKYRIDILVNGHQAGRHELPFSRLPGETGAVPCLDWALLTRLGISEEKIDAEKPKDNAQPPAAPAPTAMCGDIGQWIPQAVANFDAGALELSLSVPQVYMKSSVRGYVDPSLWDDGIDAGLASYHFAASSATRGEGDDRAYLGVNSGLNLGSWRLRHQGAQAWNSKTGIQTYQNTATYLQRNFNTWQSRLTIGDSFSSGQVLESTRMRGISLATDDRMLPQSQQGYAPVVRGVADSNATVTVSQNGYTIYETTVAPGPFVIDDLFPTGYGGDLTVRVTEANGRITSNIIPYSVAPQLLRSGTSRYSATFGQVRQSGFKGANPITFQGTLQYGLLDDLTLYGGTTYSEGYLQGKVGVAVNTPLGAFSLDATDSRTQVPGYGDGVVSGRNLGISYNKNLPQSGTNFVLGAYRFSTPGYLSLSDAVSVRQLNSLGRDIDTYARRKSRIDLTVSQKVGSGSLSFYASSSDYWGRQQGRETSYSISYGAAWRRINWNLSAQRSRVEDSGEPSQQQLSDDVFFSRTSALGRVDNRLMLTLSMPLGGGVRAPNISTTLVRNTGQTGSTLQEQVGIDGILDDEASLSYGLSGSRATGAGNPQGNFNAYGNYNGGMANMRAGYSHANDDSQVSFSANGGLITHAGGLTFSQYLGEASALVHVPNAEGALLSNSYNVKVNKAGYAVVSSLRAYQTNNVGIDPHGTAQDVELKEATQTVVPTLGAVALLKFETVSGRAVVVKAAQENGQPLPFAAQVFNEQGTEVGVIGQASKAFVRGIAEQGTLTVKWRDGADGRCYIHYQLPLQPRGQRQQSADLLHSRCVSTPVRQEVSTR